VGVLDGALTANLQTSCGNAQPRTPKQEDRSAAVAELTTKLAANASFAIRPRFAKRRGAVRDSC
jgi:hypothetical protein